MTDPNQIAERYLNTWNAEPSERAAALEHWSPDATYIDPLMSGRSREGIGTMIEAAVAQFPGHSFALDGKPDGHGPHARLRWTLAPSTGEAIAHGTDIVRLDDEGRIAEVIGFVDGAAA